MKLFRLAALMALACLMLPLAGCAEYNALKAGITYAADATVPPNIALAAANGFDAAEKTYADTVLKTCTASGSLVNGVFVPDGKYVPPAFCASIKTQIKNANGAFSAGQVIRNKIEPVPGSALPVRGSLYNALQSDLTTINAAVSAFNAAK